jgi:Phage integrase, N-terminal SAM-like domain
MRESSTPKRGKSTSDNRKPSDSPVKPDELTSVTAGYRLWLAKQPLSVNTRRTYLGGVRQYCTYLETSANDYGDPLSDPHARDYAIRDFKTHLKKARKAKPASVNLMLAALDHLYLFLGWGDPRFGAKICRKKPPRRWSRKRRNGSCEPSSGARPYATAPSRCCCFIPR